MNDPGDLQTLHAIVCRDYAKLRAEGGSADSPYLPLFINTMSTANDPKVSPTVMVLRDDGTRGVINLVELFADMGWL